MTQARSGPLVALVAGSCVAAALFATVHLARSRAAGKANAAVEGQRSGQVDSGRFASSQSASGRSASGSREFYPADRLPSLRLPDGSRQPIRSVLNIAAPLRFGAYAWQDQGIPDGKVWVYVDLGRQLLSVFRGDHEIGSAVILYGAASKPSPLGTFPVLQKAEDYHSRTYDAPMPFMLRLTADGVAVHGSNVRAGAATHGCIGVPTAFARRLFQQVRVGDPVTIVRSAPLPSQPI